MTYKPKIAGAFNDKYVDCKSEGDKKLSIEQLLKKIKPYLDNMIDILKAFHEWKTHLSMKINFMARKDNGEKQIMHSKSDDIQIIIGYIIDEIIKEFFSSFLRRYLIDLEESMKSSDFVLDYGDGLHCK